MNSYRAILEATHGHLENNDPSGVIKTKRGAKYKDIISKLLPTGSVTRRGSESTSRQKWATLKQTLYKKVPGVGFETTTPMKGLRA